ncbi:pyrethroid hydrolase Ces2e-like [Sitophilus oryzae]|uniref:Carboxylic ester hydrolase n=1 Tax=Sitophilus oryzae TaxID=7048 RepID=A0A6J2XYD2_SITOR|nr:pyrethroid hydrolase Ces2e-like [Sitophilus oryzae]
MLIFGLFFSILTWNNVNCQSPIVKISDGLIRGAVGKTVGNGQIFYAYRGIPFAKPPIGDLRFSAPVKNDPWKGILNATEDKASCVQQMDFLPLAVKGSEDCLYLNVYTKNIAGNYPVMVWIYGGGFSIGSADYEYYAPDFLLEQDVVFVSMNYRLGVFGFLSTEDLECPGNWGIKDQVMALKWIKENIRAFGGDPEQVTIFGQSAGSVSVGYLLQSHQTKHLFHRAIMQSGSSLCIWGLTTAPRQIAFAIGSRLGISTSNSRELLAKLRQVDFATLKLVENQVVYLAIALDNLLNGMPIGPVREPEHEGAVFTSRSHEDLKNGHFHKVPVIVGLNSNEAKSFLGLAIGLIKPFFGRFDLNIARLAPHDLTNNVTKKTFAGGEIKEFYFGDLPLPSTASEDLIKFVSKNQFNRPIRETVHLMSRFTDVYYYQFSHRGSLGDFESDFDGVGHYEEINYLFANKANAQGNDKYVREKIVELWTNFAKFGDPTPLPVANLTWPANSPLSYANELAYYLDVGARLSLDVNPDQEDWKFYQGIYQKYGDPPFSTY